MTGTHDGADDAANAVLLVDATGLRCPMPVIELARRVSAAELAPGSLVDVLSDDPAAGADVPAWCTMRGHAYVGSEPVGDGGAVRYRVRLGG